MIKTSKHLKIFVILALIAAVIFGTGRYFWNVKNVVKDPLPQILPPPPPVDETTKSEEEDEEDEGEDEEESQDGSSPWTVLKTALPSRYYEPTTKTETPTIALILTGLGLNKDWTARVLTTFKGKVTFVFSPYSPNIEDQLREATNLGHQALMALPLEPYGYPNPDPGPYTLLTGVKAEDNIAKTKAILKKIPKGMGVIGEYGSRFTVSQPDLQSVLKEIKDNGSIFIDPYATLHSQVQQTCKALDMTCHQVDLKITPNETIAQRDEFFKKVIQSAKENGIIIVAVPAIPAFTDHLVEWMGTLEKQGINFVTVAHLKFPELSAGTPVEHQGATNASKQDPH